MHTLVLVEYSRNDYQVSHVFYATTKRMQLSLMFSLYTIRRCCSALISTSAVTRKINQIVFIKQLHMMLNYRTSEIRGREFNSAHSGMALVASIVSTARRDIYARLTAHVQRLLLMCPAASWPPSTTTRPTNVSSQTHRAVNHRLLHHADWSAVRKRWAAHGHQWAVINRRPGACLLVATDFLGGAERHIGR